MTIPQAETHLPELLQLARRLALEYQNGSLTGWPGFTEQALAFYTPAMMEKIERVVPGWGKMASYADHLTLIHVTSVLTALYLRPEYQQASPDQRTLTEWIVLFHDVAKEARRDDRDHRHGFRSAAIAGKALPQVGFATSAAYPAEIESWCTLTHNAILYHEGYQTTIQDNQKLPEIIAGITRLYGEGTPASMVVKGVLLHMSLATLTEYPTLAPLTEAEIEQHIDAAFYPLFKMMLLADAAGWSLFDADTHQRHRHETLAALDAIPAP